VGVQALADLLHPQLARVAVVGRRADLDQLVSLQRAVDLGQHLVGEAILVPDDDDGAQVVRLGAKFAPACGFHRHLGSIAA